MTDWQIIDSTDFPDLSPDEWESPSAQPRRHWVTVTGITMVFLIVAGFVVLRERQGERRAAIREDLAVVIFEEETHQFLGNEEYAVNLMMPNAPQTWQKAYRQSFAQGNTQSLPGPIQIEHIDFDGECAVTTVVGLNGSQQVRNYCLKAQEWRRAPVPKEAWGDEQIIINVADEVQLSYRPRDRAFGERLANDLRFVFKELEQWSFLPGSVGSSPAVIPTKPASPPVLEIIIEPYDLYPPLVASEDRRVVLNSPQLVSVPDQAGLSAEDTIRLALANALLQRRGPFVQISETTLPGAANFLTAAQTIVAVRLILTPEMHTALLDTWRSQLDGRWPSPFFTRLLYPDDVTLIQQSQVSAQLMVDYIYKLWGPTTLGAIIYQLPLADSWDGLFQAMLGRSTFELERDAREVIQTGLKIDSTLRQPSSDPLPLEARFLEIDTQNPGRSRVYVELADQVEPLLVEVSPQVTFRTMDDHFLPSGCVPPGSKLEITGEWLEQPWRLRATQIIVPEVIPIAIELAPAETVAYIVEDTSQTLTALLNDGTLHPLLRLTETLETHPLPIGTGDKPHFMLVRTIPTCGRSWFVHYEPERGITGQWLGPLPPMQWVWRADHQDLMFFVRRGDTLGYDIYEADQSLSLQPVGISKRTLAFIGWNVEAGLLVSTDSWFGEVYVGLFDLDMGDILRMVRPRYQPLRSRRLSHDGKWLAHLAGIRNLFGPPDRLDVLDMNKGSESTLIQVEQGEGLGSPLWSLYLEHAALAVLSGPVTEKDELHPIRLLVTSPDRPGIFSLAAQTTDGELLAMPVFCADGTLLYRSEEKGQYRLHHQISDQPPKTLLTLDDPFQPLACP